MPQDNRQSVLFPALFSRPASVAFDEPHTTSDGGAVLLRAADERLRLTEQLARCLADPRQPAKVRHSLRDLLRQRIFGLACGYSDANDVAHLATDPLHKLLLDRDPLTGPDLASQPTLSRFENRPTPSQLLRLGLTLAETVLWHLRRRFPRDTARLVTLDLDLTDDQVHGQQQLALFNTHYDNWCFLPLLAFASVNDQPQQHLLAALLRPGTSAARVETIALLRRLIPMVRAAFPCAVIRVRLDGGFAGPELLAFLDDQQVEYLVAIARNSVLARRARRALGTSRRLARQQDQTVATYGQTWYAARRWPCQRRVVYKAEVVRLAGRKPRDNCRFVVTNLDGEPEHLYALYRQRGDIENRIKELKADLALDRTSCHRFQANQLRLLLTAAAYVLLQELRAPLARLTQAAVSLATVRLRLLKIGGRVVRSVRRIVIHLAAAHPWRRQWRRLALAWGAVVS